jgi:hypothetical protein
MIEAYLAIRAGVSPTAVDKFDEAYEAKRKPGDDSEPGDDPRAPITASTRSRRVSSGFSRSSWRQLGGLRSRGVEQVMQHPTHV